MSNEKDNAIFPEILPDEKGKLLGHNWLKVPKKKRIGDESLATPNSLKTAGYDRFIFEEYIGKDGLVKEGFIFQPALSKLRQKGHIALFKIGETFSPKIPAQVAEGPPQQPQKTIPDDQGTQGSIDLSNVDAQKLLSSIKNVINTLGSTFGGFLRGGTPASMITYNDLLRKPRINISQIPDIPLLDQFIKDPAATAETQQIFKQVYSTLGYTPPILANTLRRMYDLYEAADNVKTPYEAERVRRQINRMAAIIEGQKKWYEYGMELLNKHPEVLREVAGNELRDAANNTDRQILLAAGIAASQFLRARKAYEMNNVPFNEEKQRSRLREAVRNALYNYAGGSDPALIAKVEEVAQRLIQAETNSQTQQQAQQTRNTQQPQQAQQPTSGQMQVAQAPEQRARQQQTPSR